MNLKTISSKPCQGTQQFFENLLGFPVQKLSKAALSPERFLKDSYDSEKHRHIQRVYLAGYVGDDSLPKTSEPLKKARYRGMLLLEIELSLHSPTYTDFAQLTGVFNRASPATPIAILFAYNNRSRVALSSCERFEYIQKSKIGERIGKTATVLDIKANNPSKAHKDLLDSLTLNPAINVDSSVEEILKGWRKRLRMKDHCLLTELCREHIFETGYFPPLRDFDAVFGNESASTIINSTEWGSYHRFLTSCIHDDVACRNELIEHIEDMVYQQYCRFRDRHDIPPTATIIQVHNKHEDLLLFDDGEAEEYLQMAINRDQKKGTIEEIISRIEETAIASIDDDSDEDENLDQPKTTTSILMELDTKLLQDALEIGQYDYLKLSHWAVPKHLWSLVFEYLPSHCTFATIGDARLFPETEMLNFKSNSAKRFKGLRELKTSLSEVASKARMEEDLAHTLRKLSEADLDFPIDNELLPRHLMPIGTGSGKGSIIELLKRHGYRPTAREIRDLDISDFVQFKSIHQERILEFIALKRNIPNYLEVKQSFSMLQKSEHSDRILRIEAFDQWAQITLDKLLLACGEERLRLRHLFLDYENTNLFEGIPMKYHFKHLDTWRLFEVRQQVALAVNREDTSYFVETSSDLNSLEMLDRALVQWLRDWLSSEIFRKNDNLHKYIFLTRRGIGLKKQTLQQVGDMKVFENSKVCRERVRQLQSHAEKRLLASMPFSQEHLVDLLKYKTIDMVSKALPLLTKLLGSSKVRLLKLLAYISGDPTVLISLRDNLLHDFFAVTAAPVTREQVIDFIEEVLIEDSEGLTEPRETKGKAASEIFETLLLRNQIEYDGNRVRPFGLKVKEAVAHIFASEPNGLTVDDAIHMALKTSYLTDKKSYNYLRSLSANPYLYWSGTLKASSIFKHTRLLPEIDESTLAEIGDWLTEHLENCEGNREDLKAAYRLCPITTMLDYPAFRHYVREMSFSTEFRFDGKSRADNVHLAKANEKRIDNEERIFRLVDEAREGITKTELINTFYRKSSALINLHLSKLLHDGRVLKLSSRLFATQKNLKSLLAKDELRAFKKIDNYLEELITGIESENRILDLSLLALRINKENEVELDYPLILSAARATANKRGYQIKYSLISRQELRFNSLTDVYLQLCTPETALSEALKIVSTRVAATERVLKNAYWNYRQLFSEVRIKTE